MSPIVSNWSYLTTFIKGSPPRNGSNYVKTVGVLITSKWGCGGQEVPGGASVSPLVSNWSCLITFKKGSPPRNGYVNIMGVIIPSKWSCGGKEVPDGGPIYVTTS